jgi:putative oxygen-independent coproporphyrinogen III oxidase
VVGFGVYVHVPFCARACDYCDFAKWTDRAQLVPDYVAACRADLAGWARRDGLPPATSVFFGGGTPSLLRADELTSILADIPRRDDAEVTVECNPDSVDLEKLVAYREAGVTRLSFGVQSMTPHVLTMLGRTHEPANVTRAVACAREAGFTTFNLDLVYGTPGESLEDWRATLDGALALEPTHLSLYALTVEPGTPLGRRVAAGAAAPDDDDQAAKYEIADEQLADAGLDWYEVSNWARAGHECRHNLLTWAGGAYLPIGCAAHGHRDGRRWWNVRTPERYIERIRAGADPFAGEEHLDAEQRGEERLALALRTRAGTTVPHGARAEVVRLTEAGLLTPHLDRVVLTRRGRLLATEVTARLLVAAGTIGTRYD